MGYARKSLISLTDTPYYHCVARCVRRAWLWGVDEYAGKDYSHRKQWVLARLGQLSQIFAIDLCAYAVMSNHYHVVLHVDRLRAAQWTKTQVIERWGDLFGVPELIQRWRAGDVLELERQFAENLIEQWRVRLYDISWFMRCLNEHLARLANTEDACTGRFWEGRFKSQALLDEAGLLTAMAYVDLNPVRAGIAPTPECAEFTSIYARIRQLKELNATNEVRATAAPPLHPFSDEQRVASEALPCRLADYMHLVDWSGRALRTGKRGSMDASLPGLLQRLNIDPSAWHSAMQPSGNVFGRAMGKLNHLRLHATTLGQAWIRGLHRAEQLYGQ